MSKVFSFFSEDSVYLQLPWALEGSWSLVEENEDNDREDRPLILLGQIEAPCSPLSQSLEHGITVHRLLVGFAHRPWALLGISIFSAPDVVYWLAEKALIPSLTLDQKL